MLEDMKTLKSYERLQIQRHILPFSWISDKRLRTVGKPAQQTQHDATHAHLKMRISSSYCMIYDK